MNASTLKKPQIPQTLQALLEHQEQLSKTRIEVARLRVLIAQHEGGAKLDDSALLKTQQHRREVLADLATFASSQPTACITKLVWAMTAGQMDHMVSYAACASGTLAVLRVPLPRKGKL